MDNDYELLYLASENEEEIESLLYQKYYGFIQKKVLKYNSSTMNFDDCLNEARLALHDAIATYRDKGSFLSYLNTCLENRLINYQKSFSSNKNKLLNEAISFDELPSVSFIEESSDRYDPEKFLLEKADYFELKEKISQGLTWKEELIFNLREQNYTAKEIAEITDSNLKTVYNIISRVQYKLSNILSN